MRKPYPSIVVLATALAIAPVASAEEDSSAGEFEQAELETFLLARAEVLDIQQDYADRLQSAEDDQKVARLQSEARDEMAAAVQDAGLTVDEFNRIAQAARSDPEVAAELEALAE